MSNDNSDDWVSSSGDSQAPEEAEQVYKTICLTHTFRKLFDRSYNRKEANTNTAGDASSTGVEAPAEDEKPYPRRSTEEVERDATSRRRRSSNLSDKLAQLTTSELEDSKPEQPAPKTPQISAFPDQFPHSPGHDRTKNPMTNLPDYHDPDSPTQRRGPGIFRNPVADQWRDGAYEQWLAGADLLFDVGRRQDRWKCEYCGEYNERGITVPEPEEGTADPNDPRIGVAGPSTAAPGPARIPSSATSEPVPIPGSEPSGVAPSDLVQCANCKENINLPATLSEPRELVEARINAKVIVEEMKLPAPLDRFYEKALGEEAKRKVLERWRTDLMNKEKEEKEKEKKGKERKSNGDGA